MTLMTNGRKNNGWTISIQSLQNDSMTDIQTSLLAIGIVSIYMRILIRFAKREVRNLTEQAEKIILEINSYK